MSVKILISSTLQYFDDKQYFVDYKDRGKRLAGINKNGEKYFHNNGEWLMID